MADKKSRFDQNAYIRNYQKENHYRLSVVFSKKYDSDLIDHLKTKQSKSEYVKKLIRSDMNRDDVSEEQSE